MIPVPERLEAWHKASPGDWAAIVLSESAAAQVRLKGQGTVQDTLEKLVAGADEYRGEATISVGTEPSGKYKGGPALSFTVQGEAVGVVGARYQEDEPELFQAATEGS